MESIPNRNFDSNALPIGPRIRTFVRRKYDDFPQNLRPTLVGKLSRIALYESSEERRREEIGRLPYIRILYFLQVKSPFFVGTLEENYGL